MIVQAEVELYVRIEPYYKFVKFVDTMPGMTKLNSTIVLAEADVDMNVFDDANTYVHGAESLLITMNLPERKSWLEFLKQAIT